MRVGDEKLVSGGPVFVFSSDLTPVQIFQHIELQGAPFRYGDFGVDEDLFLLILGQQI